MEHILQMVDGALRDYISNGRKQTTKKKKKINVLHPSSRLHRKYKQILHYMNSQYYCLVDASRKGSDEHGGID